MSQLLLLNPRKRGRKAKRASAKQIAARRRFAAMARARSRGAKTHARRKRRSSPVVFVNPAPRVHRRRRRTATPRVHRRRMRRNPISGASIRLSLQSAMKSAERAAVGGLGAVGADMAMGQAFRVLPVDWQSRLSATGGINWKYYAAKFGLTFGLAALGLKVIKGGRGRQLVTTAAEGAFTVQAYEIAKSLIPSDLVTMGAYAPAGLQLQTGPAGTSSSMRTMSQLSAYSSAPRARRISGNMGAYVGVPRVMRTAAGMGYNRPEPTVGSGGVI